nr:hypothetical protein [Tanacetum cinerariifolium]
MVIYVEHRRRVAELIPWTQCPMKIENYSFRFLTFECWEQEPHPSPLVAQSVTDWIGCKVDRLDQLPTGPTRSVPEEPSRLVPKEPSRSVPEEPTRSVPKEPSRSVPEQPARSVPKEPSRSVPEEPTRSVHLSKLISVTTTLLLDRFTLHNL